MSPSPARSYSACSRCWDAKANRKSRNSNWYVSRPLPDSSTKYPKFCRRGLTNLVLPNTSKGSPAKPVSDSMCNHRWRLDASTTTASSFITRLSTSQPKQVLRYQSQGLFSSCSFCLYISVGMLGISFTQPTPTGRRFNISPSLGDHSFS